MESRTRDGVGLCMIRLYFNFLDVRLLKENAGLETGGGHLNEVILMTTPKGSIEMFH